MTNKTPGPGKDILSSSANNLYSGVSMADLRGFTEKYGLNSRLVKANGKLVEEVYRVGGRYDKEIRQVVSHLEAAIPFATEPMANALRALIQWYTTGETADRVKYDIAWVADKASPVDTINGFIEVYMDPRGIKGSWEALVFYVNKEKTDRINKFASNAQWFEDNMPYDAKYRKPSVKGIVANAIDVVIETGDSGPVTPVGINLPNDQRIREQYGSKSVSLSNVRDASDNAVPDVDANRVHVDAGRSPAQREVRHARRRIAHRHARGDRARVRPAGRRLQGHTAGSDQGALLRAGGRTRRSDRPVLHRRSEARRARHRSRRRPGSVMRAEYEAYARNAIVQLRRVREGTQIEEDHMRNRQMIVRWLMANTKSIEQRTRDNKTYLVMTDAKAFRDGVGKLLAEVQRIKSEGDYAAAKTLFETHGIHFDAALRDEIVKRVDGLNLPSYQGFVMPKLTAVKGPDGTITDVQISYPMDLTKQMLEFAESAHRARRSAAQSNRSGRSVGLFAPGPGQWRVLAATRLTLEQVVHRRVAINDRRLVLKQAAGIGRRPVRRIERLPPHTQVHRQLPSMVSRVRQPPRQHPRFRTLHIEEGRLGLEPGIWL